MARSCMFAVPGVFARVLAVYHAAVLARAQRVRVQHGAPQARVQIPQVRRTCTIAPWGSVIITYVLSFILKRKSPQNDHNGEEAGRQVSRSDITCFDICNDVTNNDDVIEL